MIELFESSEDSSTIEICQERLRISLDRLVLAGESLIKKKLSIDLRILVCFMCGGEKNDVEILIDHLASRFTLNCVNQSSFLINVVVGRANRKVKQRRKKNLSLKNCQFFFFFVDRIRLCFVSFVIRCETSWIRWFYFLVRSRPNCCSSHDGVRRQISIRSEKKFNLLFFPCCLDICNDTFQMYLKTKILKPTFINRPFIYFPVRETFLSHRWENLRIEILRMIHQFNIIKVQSKILLKVKRIVFINITRSLSLCKN